MAVDKPAIIAAGTFTATELLAATPYAHDLAVGAGVITATVGVLACGATVAYDRKYAAPAIVAGTTWTLSGSWATWTLATGPGVVNTIGGLTATGLVTLACWVTRWVRSGDPLTAAKIDVERSRTALNLAQLETAKARADDDAVTEEDVWEELPSTPWEPRVGTVATHDPIDLGGGVVLPLEGGHILIAGCTGAGKSVVMADAIADLLPRAHLRILVIDPKGDRLLSCLMGSAVEVHGVTDAGLTALEERVETMRRRGAQVAARAQAFVRGEIEEPSEVWEATAREPWDVIVVDEFTDLAGTPFMDAIDAVARKSRSLGQTLIMGTQSVGADLFKTAKSQTGGGLRSQFSTTVCGTVQNKSEADKLFGAGEAAGGWNAKRLPGKGHVLVRSPRDREPIMRRVPLMTMTSFAEVVRRHAMSRGEDADVVVEGSIPAPRAPLDDAEGTHGERVSRVLADGAWHKVADITTAAGVPNAAVTRAVLARLRKARMVESDGAGLFRGRERDSNVTVGPWDGA